MKTNSRAPSSKMKKTEEAHRKMHFKNNFSTCDPFKIEKKKKKTQQPLGSSYSSLKTGGRSLNTEPSIIHLEIFQLVLTNLIRYKILRDEKLCVLLDVQGDALVILRPIF